MGEKNRKRELICHEDVPVDENLPTLETPSVNVIWYINTSFIESITASIVLRFRFSPSASLYTVLP